MVVEEYPVGQATPASTTAPIVQLAGATTHESWPQGPPAPPPPVPLPPAELLEPDIELEASLLLLVFVLVLVVELEVPVLPPWLIVAPELEGPLALADIPPAPACGHATAMPCEGSGQRFVSTTSSGIPTIAAQAEIPKRALAIASVLALSFNAKPSLRSALAWTCASVFASLPRALRFKLRPSLRSALAWTCASVFASLPRALRFILFMTISR